MATSHKTREGEAREPAYKPPSLLEAPAARPGFVQRWIRVMINNTEDLTNFAKARREGWEPVRIDSLPEKEREYFMATPLAAKNSKFEGVIGQTDVILCELPVARAMAIKEYYRQQTELQTKGYLDDVRQSNDHLAPFDRPEMKIRHTTARPRLDD